MSRRGDARVGARAVLGSRGGAGEAEEARGCNWIAMDAVRCRVRLLAIALRCEQLDEKAATKQRLR